MESRIWILLILMIVISINSITNAESEWCSNGTVTQTTDECICSSHLGYFCQDSGKVAVNNGECQSGYGISFYHHKCDTCKCMIDQAWIERRKVALGNRKRQQQYQN